MPYDERENRFICDKLDCSKTATNGKSLCFEHFQEEMLKPARTDTEEA